VDALAASVARAPKLKQLQSHRSWPQRLRDLRAGTPWLFGALHHLKVEARARGGLAGWLR